MKQIKAFFKEGSESGKIYLKRSRLASRKVNVKENKQNRIRTVISVNAGHVRGGHSFH